MLSCLCSNLCNVATKIAISITSIQLSRLHCIMHKQCEPFLHVHVHKLLLDNASNVQKCTWDTVFINFYHSLYQNLNPTSVTSSMGYLSMTSSGSGTITACAHLCAMILLVFRPPWICYWHLLHSLETCPFTLSGQGRIESL